MIKRFIATFLLLAMLCACAGAAIAERVAATAPVVTAEYETLKDALAGYLDSQDYTYEFNADKNRFEYSMSLDSSLKSCDVYINLEDNNEGFMVLAFMDLAPRKGDQKAFAGVGEYMMRANYALNLGKFQMDYSDGEISYMTSAKCFDRIPSQKEIEWLVDIPPIMIEKYGEGLAAIILTGADPAKTFEEADKDEDSSGEEGGGLTRPDSLVLPSA